MTTVGLIHSSSWFGTLICDEAGLWLISDEAYEDFVFDGAAHYSPIGPNVINIFTFSKSYGLAGWRVGYVLFPPELKGMGSAQV